MVEKLKKSYKFVDIIFGTHNIFKFAELLCEVYEREEMVIDIWEMIEKNSIMAGTNNNIITEFIVTFFINQNIGF